MLQIAIVLAAFQVVVSAVQANLTYHCTTFLIPITVVANATLLKLQIPNGQRQLSGIIQQTFSLDSNVTAGLVGGKLPLTATYSIWSQLCVPEAFADDGILEFAVHGINLDHLYWELGGAGSSFNYVEAALRAGHAIFTFDRLGTGLSSTPDGIKEVQTSTQVEVLAELVAILRGGIQGFTFGSIVGIGHSYGSYLLAGLASSRGSILDGIVLTGFSTFVDSIPTAVAGLGLGIAAELNNTKFGTLSFAYATPASIINIQQIFFFYPEFTQSSLNFIQDHKGGELLTLSEAIAIEAKEYKNSVLVISGDKDIIVCGGNCFQSTNGSENLLESSQKLFPLASNFSISIPARTGHLINGHFSAPETFRFITKWIDEQE